MRSKQTKATGILSKVKAEVWDRDGGQCIICGSYEAMPNMHYIRRSKGGLGIAKNVVTGCIKCHHDYDNGNKREEYGDKIRGYLRSIYPGWNERDLIYDRWKNGY